jgi:N-acyl amino acid synthase of PEP-CTERM/exosortase system
MLRGDYRRLTDHGLADLTSGKARAGLPGDRRDEASQVLLSLYRQLYLYSRAKGIDHWYAAMERPLARSLQRMNIAFREIGPQTDYYGPVAPYLAHLHEVEAQVAAHNPGLLAWLQQAGQDEDSAEFDQPDGTRSSGGRLTALRADTRHQTPGACP